MRVRVLHRAVGKVGSERVMDNQSARVLILLGRVEAVDEPKERKRRSYKRRDMVAEQPRFSEEQVYEAFNVPAPEDHEDEESDESSDDSERKE